MPNICFFKRWILPILLLTLCIQGKEIKMEFNPLQTSEDSFFEINTALSQIVTDQHTIELNGNYEGGAPFLLLSVNDQDFPQYLQNGSFTHRLALRSGINNIVAIPPHGYDGQKSYKIIRISGGSVNSVHFLSKGKEPSIAVFKENALPTEPMLTHNPVIQIRGSKAQPNTAKVSVKDHYGNPVQVMNENDEFVVPYILREGINELTFRSNYEDKTFKTEKLIFNLSEVISIEADSESNGSYLEKGMTANSYSYQGKELVVIGHVASVSEGEIQLTVNKTTTNVPVENHQFRTQVKLNTDELNIIKASTTAGNQTFFDHIEVSQVTPTSSIQYLTELTLDGTIFLDRRTLIPEEGQNLETYSPALRVGGKSSFLGNLEARILNSRTKAEYRLGQQSGKFETIVLLEEGENELQVLFGKGINSILADQTIITLLPTIVIEQINDSIPTSETTSLDTSACHVRGRIPSINRGLLTFSYNDIETTAPIIAGRFETNTPLSLSVGENNIVASFKVKGKVYSKHLTIEVLPAVEDESEDDEIVSEIANASLPANNPLEEKVVLTEKSSGEKVPEDFAGDDTAQEEDAAEIRKTDPSLAPAGKFTPPSPVKTPQPQDVIDPETGVLSTGAVTLKFTINKKGRVDSKSIFILESSNETLNEEAIRAVSQWRFRAARMNNKPIELSTKITLNWRE